MSAAGWIVADDAKLCEAGEMTELVYCRVVYAKRCGKAPERRLGYFDGGEWKASNAIKFYSYGARVTHWYAAPELPE